MVGLVQTNTKPQPTMSKIYHATDAAFAISKVESREKIATSIKLDLVDKVVHYLGGQSKDTPFESQFNKGNTTFFRYEKDLCDTPKQYTEADWDGDNLKPKKESHFGYFINDNFFESYFDILPIVSKEKNYYWLDFCGMPTEELLDSIYYSFFCEEEDNSHVQDIYLTFYLNPRGIKFVSNLVNRYGDGLEERAQSLCDSIRERFNVDSHEFSVFDSYINNGNSPMAVIKLKRKEK